MKAQKREQQGRVLRKSSTQAKVLLDFKKEQAGQSLASVQTQQQKQLEEKRSQLIQSQQQLEHVKKQQFVFQHHAEKTGEILRVKHFHRKTSQHQPFDLALQAGEKIHLKGKNGIGKSTFLTYLSQTTSQSSHETFLSVHTLYLDQNLSNLSPELSVMDNLAKFNPEVSSTEWRNQLGQLRIRGQKAELPFHCLSGGERLKVTLLGLNYLTPNIELLLLDEPENHLDIESRMLLAQAIQHYTGAVILVSHDAYFVESCGIQSSVQFVE
ncbi:ATP-binding cassette domain-containing protein [Avibacterium paragallinarum]